jgi:hypothetical protein
MAFDGRLLSAPPPRGEQPLADALLVEYAGVVVSPPSVPVVSPNGDKVAESEAFTYKVVRPSAVTVQLVGPDGAARINTQAQLSPGIYPLQWNARRADGTPEQEGRWTLTVSAVDDLGRSSSETRTFSLDDTLGAPAPVGPALPVPRKKARAVATFALSRQARVTERIETTGGVILRRLGTTTAGPGKLAVAWDGKTASGATVYSGRFVAHVFATGQVGTSDLTATFAVRRQ